MTALARPDVRLHESWSAAVREFGPPAHIAGAGLWHLPEETWVPADRAACAAVVAAFELLDDPAARREAGQVPGELLWIVDGEPPGVVGFISLRFELNDFLRREGGHVGYSVRPSRRREGHASRALGLALDRLAERGVDRALVTCDDDNVGSLRTIEGAGGVLEDVVDGTRRYWISLARRRPSDGGRPAPS